MWVCVGPLVIQGYSLMDALPSSIQGFHACFKHEHSAIQEGERVDSPVGRVYEPDLDRVHIISDNLHC